MSLTAISTSIRGYMSTNYTTTPISYENDGSFDTPNETWVKLNILTGDSVANSIGKNPCYREYGIIDVQVFQPIAEGTNVTESVADEIAVLFRSKRIDNVLTKIPRFTKLGIIKNFNQTNVSIDYEYFEQVK